MASETSTILNKICVGCKDDFTTERSYSRHCNSCFKSLIKPCERCGEKYFTDGFKQHCKGCFLALQRKTEKLKEVVAVK